MRNNWRLEPILQFKLETIKANVQQIGDDKKPCGPLTYSEDIVFDIDNMQDYWHDAIYWYKKAALHNEPLAIKMLQCIADFQSTEQKAMAGDTEAQYLLSVYYEDGYGIFTDLDNSVFWLKAAAINGNEQAIESIKEYEKMTGKRLSLKDKNFYAQPYFRPDDYEYLYMLERHGQVRKEYMDKNHVGELWKEFSKLDFQKTEREANYGNAEAQYKLAWLYDWGQGVKQDIKQAIRWFVESAYGGYAPAQTELGIMYQYGIMATSLRLVVIGKSDK